MKNVIRITFVCAAVALGITTPVSAEALKDLADHTHYHGIAFARSGSATLLLATHHGIFAVDMAGTATQVSPVHDYMGFAPDPYNPLNYYASGHPSGGGNSGFLKSTDGGATWEELSAGAGGPVDFHQMDVSPVDPKVIYGVYGDFQVSRDGGETWLIAGKPPAKLISIAASGAKVGQIYAATQNGLHMSADAGASWQPLVFDGEVVSTIKAGPNGTLLAFVLGRGFLKTTEDKPKDWTVLSNSFGNAIPLHVAIDPADDNHLALTTQANDVLESRDGGSTWTPFGKAP
jgi:photosystem II stability/assembly factor-like uncharacterized protein